MNVYGVLELIADVDKAVSVNSLPEVYTSCGVLTERLKKLDDDGIPADCAAKYFKAAKLVDLWSKDVRGANLTAWPAASEILRKVVSMMNDHDDDRIHREKIINFWSDKKYEIVNNNMGSGAFGRAVLVRDVDADVLQVAKVYDPVGMEAENRIRFYQFFKSEIKILHVLNHRNIVRIFAAHLYESRRSGKKVIEDNSFEYTLSNISILASVFIQGAYKYDGRASISLDAVKAFYAWFGSADENKREMILSSLRSRLGQIHVNSPVDEMPF